MYRVYCAHCNEHIYDYTESDLPKMGDPFDNTPFRGVNGYPDPVGSALCPACGDILATYVYLRRGPGHLGSFMRFEPKEEAACVNT